MIRKLNCIIVLLLLIAVDLFGQTVSRTTIKGVLCDTAGISVPSAVVLLLATKDSAFLNFAQTDEKGAFEFRNVKNSGYLLKIQHMSYIPYQKLVPVSSGDLTDLGKIKLKVIAKVLREVVIEAAKAPLKFYGDTIEYDATAFKVPPGSTVEDLLRRLPGVDVDVQGNIKSEGKDVKRLYVEGKTFFGNDPLFATKNLGAEIVSKVQFFDEKSDHEKLTGVKEPVHDTKAMNLSLKEEFKQGGFGKLTAAAGDQDRREMRGNYNRFDKKQMLSVIGYGNNLNQTGVNWDDYSEYTGQSISGSINSFESGPGFIDFGIGNPLRNSFDGRGLTDNYGGGVNYNLDNNKTKISSNYNYNEISRKLFQTSNRETFIPTGSFKNADTTQTNDFIGKHYLEFCIEQDFDKANIVFSKSSIVFSTSKGNSSTMTLYSDANNIKNQSLDKFNTNNLSSWSANSIATYKHIFKKEGAAFYWNGEVNSAKSNGLDNPNSFNRFFEANTFTDQIRALNTNSNNTSTQFKTTMALIEPLSKKINLEVVYNFSASQTMQDKLTQNTIMQNIRVDSLTAYNTYHSFYNRIATNFTYNYKNLYVSAKVTAQQMQINGNYSLRKELPDLIDPINKTYTDLLPDFFVRYLVTKTTNLYAGYSDRMTTPMMSDLMPIVNVNDPSYLVEGNPNLRPSRDHAYSFRYSTHFGKPSSSLNFSLNYRETKNSISMARTYNMIENIGMQTVIRPENMKGIKKQTNLSVDYSLRLINSKLSMKINSSLIFGKSPTLINDVETFEKNTSASLGATFNLTLSQKLLLGLSGNMNFNSIRGIQGNNYDQKIKYYTSNSSLRWQIAVKTYFESALNYSIYKNASLGFDRNIPLLNASIRQIVGKANKIELRLSANDIFNKNLSISQTASEHYIMSTVSNNLARYFLLSLSYNLKGFEVKSE